MKKIYYLSIVWMMLMACNNVSENTSRTENMKSMKQSEKQLAEKYVTVELNTDLSLLTENEKKMIPLLIEAAKQMDEVFWLEAYGDKNELFDKIQDSSLREFVKINYGPWDRLDGNKPFVPGYGHKPKGANFYPVDMTIEEFEMADLPDKTSLYTLIRRDSSGKLVSVPYHEAFEKYHKAAAKYLKQAAALAEDEGLRKYLYARAEALLTDQYRQSDMLWMDMKNNRIDVVIGPIENYEDQLFGYKTAHEAFVLVKDMEWSKKLSKYTSLLPELQEGLPVEKKYKSENPGLNSDLNAYDAVYYAGDANAGAKTIAINLPNDEEVQLKKGSRRLQLKNVMKAKFDKILLPISEVLISPDQRQYISFDAFFGNTMFHEVAHGLGIKNTVTGKGPVRTALKELYTTIEEGKADILGLYMIFKLKEKNLLEPDLKDYMTTFMAGIFRSIRFGASSAHARANLIRFNFFKEKGAFVRNEDGTYSVDYNKMPEAVRELSSVILTLQGDGDYEKTKNFVEKYGVMDDQLKQDLNKINKAGIPVDIIFKQGTKVLGL